MNTESHLPSNRVAPGYDRVTLAESFDNLSSTDVRLIEKAFQIGPVRLRVFDDELIQKVGGVAPTFPLPERLYALTSVRFVDSVEVLGASTNVDDFAARYGPDPGHVVTTRDTPALHAYGARSNVAIHVFDAHELKQFPAPPVCPVDPKSDRKKIIVTGCFDWLHTGHVRFFEEVSEHGDLYVVVGSDANIRLLKGEGKPMFPEAQRCYTAGAIKFVKAAMVSTGRGWLDAEPEVQRLRPDAYAVNEDGDVPEKRAFCARHGIEYIVLKRLPKAGLSRRSSTALRGY